MFLAFRINGAVLPIANAYKIIVVYEGTTKISRTTTDPSVRITRTAHAHFGVDGQIEILVGGLGSIIVGSVGVWCLVITLWTRL
jgi:hypothetical protein